MATCVDLAGAAYPQQIGEQAITPMQGQCLKPLLTGDGQFNERPLFWEHEGNAAIRVGDHKLVRLGMQGNWELFDLQADRTEQHDLSAKHPDEAAALQMQWHKWATNSNVLPKPQKRANAKKKK